VAKPQPKWRRLLSLLYRRFLNLLGGKILMRFEYSHSADLEIGDTAGWETCATSFLPLGNL
jgi:hypothetical protein